MGEHRYAVGPELQHLLASERDVLVVASQQEFERTIAACLFDNKSQPQHLLALVAELIAVRLPLLALALLAQQDDGTEQQRCFCVKFLARCGKYGRGRFVNC